MTGNIGWDGDDRNIEWDGDDGILFGIETTGNIRWD